MRQNTYDTPSITLITHYNTYNAKAKAAITTAAKDEEKMATELRPSDEPAFVGGVRGAPEPAGAGGTGTTLLGRPPVGMLR